MKRIALLVALLALLAAACGETQSQLEGTAWTFTGHAGPDGNVIDALPGTDASIAFDADTVSGSDGCNDFTGPYEISSGNMIDIGPLASTQKACEPDVMDQADTITSVLTNAILYEKTGDDVLVIRTQTADFVGYDRAN